MIGIIYKTTCLKDGKIYVGQHRVKDKETLDPWYVGSGSDLEKYIDEAKQEDRLNWLKFFQREVLKICYTQNQLNGYEAYFINKFDATNPNIGLNILKSCCFKKSGASRDKRVAKLGAKVSEETRLKLSNIRRGKKHSKTWSEKIGKSQRGNNCKFTNTIWIYNYKEGVNKRIPIGEEIPIGWNRGRMSYFD
jgi:hypothetical protein